jgi:glutathione peroxidase
MKRRSAFLRRAPLLRVILIGGGLFLLFLFLFFHSLLEEEYHAVRDRVRNAVRKKDHHSVWDSLLLGSTKEPTFEWHYADGSAYPETGATRATIADYLNGKVVIVVNVASHCGYTDQNYKGLVQLYQQYQKEGLEILAFPSDDYQHQEPDPAEIVQAEMLKKYNVTFRLMSKVHVKKAPKGTTADQVDAEHVPLMVPLLFQRLKAIKGHSFDIPWNFAKFVIGRNGRNVTYFSQKDPFDHVVADVKGKLAIK